MIRILPLLILLTGCFERGGGDPSGNEGTRQPPITPPPAEGTLLSSSCDEYTLIEEIADGNGGSTTRTTEKSEKCGWNPPASGTVIATSCDGYTLQEDIADGEYGVLEVRETPRSPECGWDPPPAGTVLEAYCDGYTLVEVIADGEYGSYEEREGKNVDQCGYPPFSIEVKNGVGDRFEPVSITVESVDEWSIDDVELNLGYAVREGNEIHVYGDGLMGTGQLTIRGEEIQYTIAEEPICEVTEAEYSGVGYDCMGYRVNANAQRAEGGYIYYGEDDDRIVVWELAIVWWVDESFPVDAETYQNHEGLKTAYEVGSPEWEEAQELVTQYNETYARSGVHVRFVLPEGNTGTAHYHDVGDLSVLRKDLRADVILGMGFTCDDACGCAQVQVSFRENDRHIPSGTSRCGWDTDLHEIGHGVGLAHGPLNAGNAAEGYVWPDFGHGWEGICSYYGDIMSYEPVTLAHHNSTLTCGEMYGDRSNVESDNEAPAGSRDYADAAYHINRIRYDVSLVHCGDICRDKESTSIPDKQNNMQGKILIEDKTDDFVNGRERLEEFLNRYPEYRYMEREEINHY